jgi:hypothetical protein
LIAIENVSARLKIVRRLLTILFCLLLVGQTFATQFSLNCSVQRAGTSTHRCDGMGCCCKTCNMKSCAAKSDSQPVVPSTRLAFQNQLLIVATTLTWNWLPTEMPAQKFSSVDHSLRGDAVPIFQRDCAILI